MTYKSFSMRTLGTIGCLIFIPLFVFTFMDPHLIEKSGRSFVAWKLEVETQNKIDAVSLPEPTKMVQLLGEKAKNVRLQAEQRLDEIKRYLDADMPNIIASQIAKMSNLDCECRKRWEQAIRTNKYDEMVSLQNARAKLIDFTQVKYMEIVEKLTKDVRIVLGANAVIFLMLLVLSFAKPRAINHLIMPSILIFISTAICSYFYFFEQNWLYTIIYNDYTGFGFIAYLLGVFGLLCDIAFNKARVTTEIINRLLSLLGNSLSLVAC